MLDLDASTPNPTLGLDAIVSIHMLDQDDVSAPNHALGVDATAFTFMLGLDESASNPMSVFLI
jgi:hypothetical protein